ncbi:MAG: outer membrane beta-barrel protein, partial [Bacteroidia bacterium]
SNTLLNQLIDQAGDVRNYGMSADFSEPMNKKISISANYSYSNREDIIERIVYDYDLGTTRYDLLNNELSRNLQNFNESHSIALRATYKPSDKLTFTLNGTQKYVVLEGKNVMSNQNLATDYLLFEPNFTLSYKINKVSSLSANGSRYNYTPSVSQLQPLTDNSNPLYITTGNPELRPSTDNNFSLNYNRFNPTSASSINAGLNFYMSENRIINNSILAPKTGIQTTFYDNIDGAYNFSARLGGSFRIKSLGLTFNPNVNVGRAKNVSFLNQERVSSNSTSLGVGTSVNYALGTDLQFSNRISATFREVAFNYNNLADQNFTSIFNSLSLNAALPYELRFILTSNV